MIIANQEIPSKGVKPVEFNGKEYWPSYFLARAHSKVENGVRVIRWVQRPGKYTTMYR